MNFKDDYSIGAHPLVMEQIVSSNNTLEASYQQDFYSIKAAELIKKKISSPYALVRFVAGGTLANLLVIAASLRPHEAVISVESGHINLHETGAIENTGHKIISVQSKEGKITPSEILKVLETHNIPPHTVKPKMVYLSNSTELGSIYTKNELKEIVEVCKKNNLFLFMDGARLGMALSSKKNDLTLREIAQLTDAFYIGGTKNGALMGEAIIINNEELKTDFDFHLKQKGALVAKTRFFGAQFLGLFKNDLYFELAGKANQKAKELKIVLEKYKIPLKYPVETNQVFPILRNAHIDELKKKVEFYVWEPHDEEHSVIRLITNWQTSEDEIKEFDQILSALLKN